MGFIVFEEEAFCYLDALLENFVKRMDRIRKHNEDKAMSKWLDTLDVCQMLNICPRTVRRSETTGPWLTRRLATRPTISQRT